MTRTIEPKPHFLSAANGNRLLALHRVLTHRLRLLSCFSGAALSLGLLFGFVASPLTIKAQFPYTTGFENPPFTNPMASVGAPSITDSLIGYDGWTTDGVLGNGGGSGATGVVTTGLGSGQAAYIGGRSALGTGDVYVYHHTDLSDPVANGTPLIRFSVDLYISPSINGLNDTFGFVVFNSIGQIEAGIDFSTNSQYLFNSASGNAADGDALSYPQFYFYTTYTLVIDIDYSTKKWNATLQGGDYVDPTPIFTVPQSIPNGLTGYNLADIDAVWTLRNKVYPGTNYMLFDNYSVTVAPVPTLSIAQTGKDPASGDRTFTLSWPSSASTWTLQLSPSLTNPGWVSLTPTSAVNGQNQAVVTLSSSDSRMFFRLTPP